MKYTLPALCLCLVALSSTFAQEEEPRISITFSCFSWEEPIDGFHFLMGNRSEAVSVPNRGRSSVYRYTGSPNLIFFTEQETPEGIVRHPRAQVSLPLDAKGQYLFVFAQSPTTGGPSHQILALRDEPIDSLVHAIRVFNLTDDPLACKFVETTVTVPRKSVETASYSRPERGAVPAQIAVPDRETGEWRMGYSALWGYLEGMNYTVFVIPDNTASGISVRTFKEMPQAPQNPSGSRPTVPQQTPPLS